MAQGGVADWLKPSAFGLPLPEEGPLSSALLAAGILLFSGWLNPHDSARLVCALLVGLGLIFLWWAAFLFARRPEIQPSDPFGASASPGLISRSMADAAVLVALACCGPIIRLHETTPEAVQFTWTALLLLGAALSLEHPRLGGILAGIALAATALGTSPLLAILLGAAWLSAHLWSPPMRVRARPSILPCLLVGGALTTVWPLALMVWDDGGWAWLSAWWQGAWVQWAQIDPIRTEFARTLAWFAWPAWPLAIWTLWKWRRLLREPALFAPVAFALAVMAHLLLQSRSIEQAMIPLVLPLALLAIWGLPTMARRFAELLDWLAVSLFSLFLVFIWSYWLALHLGYPPRMAASAVRVAPDYQPGAVMLSGLIGAGATLAWLLVIRWRLSARSRVVWRPVVLSASGLVITWVLLVTLWLPIFDQRKSLRGPALEASATITRFDTGKTPGTPLVCARDLGPAERTAFAYFGSIRISSDSQTCGWLLRGSTAGSPSGRDADDVRWERVWQGGRRIDPAERFTLYRRAP
jgi:hypothetical protein